MTPDFWRARRVFMTGHTGFKGGWLSLWLQSLGAELTGFALAPSAEQPLFACARVGDHMQSVIGDIRDGEALGRALARARPEIVLHLAAQQPATLDRLREDADPLLLESMAPGKRAYAAAKRDAEACFQALGRAGQRVAIARGFAFVGPWLPRDLHFAIGNFLADGLAGRPIRVQARHPVWRSYLHADDLVHWLMTLVSAAEPACPVVNVGSDQDYLLDDVARRVGAAFGLPAELPDMAAGPVDRYVPSIDRARERFGLRVTRSLDQAIEATIASTVRSA